MEFDGPVSAAQLFLPLTLPPAASSLFLDHWEEALKALVTALAAHSPLAERQALAVLEQAQTVFGLFVPRFATAETLAETDRQAVGAARASGCCCAARCCRWRCARASGPPWSFCSRDS